MVKHVILWKLKDELAGEEKEQVKAGIKKGLEASCRTDSRTYRGKSKNRVSSKFYSRCNVRHNI